LYLIYNARMRTSWAVVALLAAGAVACKSSTPSPGAEAGPPAELGLDVARDAPLGDLRGGDRARTDAVVDTRRSDGPRSDASKSDTGSKTDTGKKTDGPVTKPDTKLAADTKPKTDSSTSCLGSSLLASLGKNHILVGAAMDDTIAASAPFDLRYQYIAGGIFDGTQPCATCAKSCTSNGSSCANSNPNGCAWWGCWQYDALLPGEYVRSFITTAQGNKQIPMFTYYEILQASGVTEGAPEVNSAATNQSFMSRYLADWRFVLQNIGSNVAFLHIEPDFWGYAEQINQDPHQLPAAVATANATDCATAENTIAGLGECMIAMVRKYAPNAKVGLHASSWGTKTPALYNTNPAFNLTADAQKLASFLKACGAAKGDYIVLDISDRDAGYYQSIGQNSWWDATNATLPSYTQGFTWAKALAEAAGLPILWWQIPVGNMSLNNTTNHWKDNRVEYLFAHPAELAACHSIGIAFGAGDGDQTTPSTDGGLLVSKVKAYSQAGGQPPCP
jgi:hypothetical protein